MISSTKIFLYAEDIFAWLIILEPISESISIGKTPALHQLSQQEILRDALWNALQQLAIKPRFALPIEIYLPNRRMKRDFLPPLFHEELERVLGNDYKEDNIKLKIYGRFSSPRKFLKSIILRHRYEPSFATQRYLDGTFRDW